jgi:hypothetical protein
LISTGHLPVDSYHHAVSLLDALALERAVDAGCSAVADDRSAHRGRIQARRPLRLRNLIGRAGWHQYLAREDDAVVGARGMHIGADGTAWLGMDGPVPGVTTDDYEPDAALCAFIVADGLVNGARRFIADIELPSADQATPAYESFRRLGFTRPYVRTHWTRR